MRKTLALIVLIFCISVISAAETFRFALFTDLHMLQGRAQGAGLVQPHQAVHLLHG